jgi:bile acid:Na+ symporter, BASS family
MKLSLFIERYYWIFFITGLGLGLIYPVYNDFLMSLLKLFLIIMLLLVFLKTDVALILKKIQNFRLMAFVVILNMIVVPVLFFFLIDLFDHNLAIGILLLTSMPAAVASPALTDIVKGNTALSTSIVIITSIIAPLTVPILFWLIQFSNVSINPWWLFKDLVIILILPVIASQVIKKYLSHFVAKKVHMFTSVNIMILSLMVYAVMGSQRNVILSEPLKILWQIGFLYLVFILLHILGFFMGYTEDKKGKIATTIGTAYMNNGMAIVLAALYFEPTILILMVLSELPWNTLLIPFKKIIVLNNKNIDFQHN